MFAPKVLVDLSKLAGRLAGPVAPPLGWLPLAAGRGPETVRTQGFGPQFDPEADHDTSGSVAGGSQSAGGGGRLIFPSQEMPAPLGKDRGNLPLAGHPEPGEIADDEGDRHGADAGPFGIAAVEQGAGGHQGAG